MKPQHFLKKPLTSSQDLSLGALSYTTSIGRNFKLEEVSIHFSQGVSETVKVFRDSRNGVNYDSEIGRRTLISEPDFVFRPQGELNCLAGDEIKVTCTNAGGVGTAYLEIRTSEM